MCRETLQLGSGPVEGERRIEGVMVPVLLEEDAGTLRDCVGTASRSSGADYGDAHGKVC
eukprot:COSAG01_NODE_9314_length_2486_cov_1.285714_3_plen_59_part_00